MGKLKVAGLMAVILALSSFSLLGKHQDDKDKKDKKSQKKVGIHYQEAYPDEALLRRMASKTVMPVYPEEAIQDGAQGLADVAVLFDENGDYKGMKVLESPHPAISKAVADALRQWKITLGYDSPFPETRLPIRHFAEVRFHFVIRDGNAVVEPATPEEQQTTSLTFRKIAGGGKDKRPDAP